MRRTLKLIVWSLGGLIAAVAVARETAPPAQAALPNQELARRVAAYVQPLADAGELSGTLLVAKEGTVVYERAFGMADYELNVPNTPVTAHCVASINKPLTAIAAIRLMEQKKLAPGDPLSKWIPGFPRGEEITVEHELLEEYVFAPAGAIHSVSPVPHRLIPGRARSYVGGFGQLEATSLQDLTYLVGAGSLFTTPRDLLSIMQTLLNGGYGEGARASLLRDGGLAWNGITNGYRAFADYHPGGKLTVIFTSNVFTGASDLLRRDLPKLAAGETVEPARVPRVEPVAVPPTLRARAEGIYEFRPGARESLVFNAEGTRARVGERTLVPVADGTFFCPQDYARVKLALRPDGSVEALEWEISDGSIKFPRVGPLEGG